MARWFSCLFIVAGLILAGLGFDSIWTARQEESKAQEEWDRDSAARPAIVEPGRRVKKNRGEGKKS